jgi:hypothetical protein
MSPPLHNARSSLGLGPSGRQSGGWTRAGWASAGWLLLSWVSLGCASGPPTSHGHMSNESSRLRPAVIQQDLKTRFRNPFDFSEKRQESGAEGEFENHPVMQVAWVDDRADSKPATNGSSRRTARQAAEGSTLPFLAGDQPPDSPGMTRREQIRNRIPIPMPAARNQLRHPARQLPSSRPLLNRQTDRQFDRPANRQNSSASSMESDSRPSNLVPGRQPSGGLRSPPNPAWNPPQSTRARPLPQSVPVELEPQQLPELQGQEVDGPADGQAAEEGVAEGERRDAPWAQIARYLWQPPTPEPPRELPVERTPQGPRDPDEVVDHPIVFRSISEIGTRITPPTEVEREGEQPYLPEDRATEYFSQFEPYFYRSEGYRPWDAYAAMRITQAFCHRPLYFEEINVERFGRSAGILQPAVSAARFFATVPTLPYRMAIDHPAVCQVDPSPYPPGAPAPRHRQAPPFRIRAALVQAVAVVGIIAIFP